MTIKRAANCLACLICCALASSTVWGESPVLHLDFSSLADVSGSNLNVEVGESVSRVEAGGPLLAAGTQLDSGLWAGNKDSTNQILVLDSEILDNVSTSAGSIVAWIKPENGDGWNNIVKTPCEDNLEPCAAFNEFRGLELQTSGLHAGVFGSVQGWNTNAFSPTSPLRTGGPTDTPSGVWTHTALTWNADGDHTLFVDGQASERLEGVGEEAFGLNDTGDWTIGGDGLHPERYLHGELADFAIFGIELAAEDISAIIDGGVAAFASPCDPDTGGDLDGDGVVAFSDFLVLSANFGATVGGHAEGDLDCSGTVDFADFLVMSSNFGNPSPAARAVPEPGSISLIVLAAMACGVCRRRR